MYGVIDIGSNTIRLVIYKAEAGRIKPLLNKKFPAGLAGYVDKQNRMQAAGIQKAVEALQAFQEILGLMRLREVFPFATASLRNIENTKEALAAIRTQCGLEVQVLSGEQEALFDYYGAVQSMRLENGLLTDVGGGSTELVFFQKGELQTADSLPIGSLNLYNRFVKGITPTFQELAKMEKEAEKRLQKQYPAGKPWNKAAMGGSLGTELPPDAPAPEKGEQKKRMLCTVGGSARAILKVLRELGAVPKNEERYDVPELERLVGLWEKQPEKLTRQLIKTVPDRLHTFWPGLAVIKTAAEWYGAQQIAVSPYGVREGYLYYQLEKRGELYGE